MFENYDATWYEYDYRPIKYGQIDLFMRDILMTERERFLSPSYSEKINPEFPPLTNVQQQQITDYIAKTSTPKETTEMSNGLSVNDQNIIDDAVREAIEKPRREAEIRNRVAAVEALSPMLEEAVPGTVIRFKRSYGKKDYSYATIKIVRNEGEEPVWYTTGTDAFRADLYSTEGLLRWMTTGATLVSDVQVASQFVDVTWTPVTTPTIDVTDAA